MFIILNACSKSLIIKINAINPLPIERSDELIVISKAQLSLYEIPENGFPIVYINNNEEIPSQIDDINLDGIWDELAFSVDFKAQDTLDIIIKFQTAKPSYTKSTNIRLAKKDNNQLVALNKAERIAGKDTKITSTFYQMEGPAWENDKVAFRNYLDERNGMDIFGKITEKMILDSVGINEDYHKMQEWGMDILKVGSSLGAGALAFNINDTLFRLAIANGSYAEIVNIGPVRSILNLNFPAIKIDESSFDLIQQISIAKGKYYYENCLRISKHRYDVVSGIVKLHSDTLIKSIDDMSFYIATHDTQAYNKENLGMAIMGRTKDLVIAAEAPSENADITQTYYCQFKESISDNLCFRFYACWEESDEIFKNRSSFLTFLDIEKLKYNNPIIIHLK